MLALIADAAMVGGRLLSAYGTYKSGKQADMVGKYNQHLYNQRAKMVEMAKESQTDLMVEQQRGLKAKQRAQAAAMGGGVSSGTPLIVLADQAGKMQEDLLTTRWNMDVQASGLRAQGIMARWEGKQAKNAANMQTAGSLLGSGAN